MDSSGASGNMEGEMEVEAFKRLFPLRFRERHLLECIRPDARPLGRARESHCRSWGGCIWISIGEDGHTDIYCLDGDGALFDAALLSARAFSHLQIPAVSINKYGRLITMFGEDGDGKLAKDPVIKEKRKLTLNCIPFSLTCILHKKYFLADPNAEEESVIETHVSGFGFIVDLCPFTSQGDQFWPMHQLFRIALRLQGIE